MYLYAGGDPINHVDPTGEIVMFAIPLGITVAQILLFVNAASSDHPAAPADVWGMMAAVQGLHGAGELMDAAGAALGRRAFGEVLSPLGGAGARDIPLARIPAETRSALAEKYSGIIDLLRRGDVAAPQGSMSAEFMAELSVATGNEVGLIRRASGARVLRMGTDRGIRIAAGDVRLIAHTHLTGNLTFSIKEQTINGVLTWFGDIPTLERLGQRSSVLIGPTGRAVRPHLSAF